MSEKSTNNKSTNKKSTKGYLFSILAIICIFLIAGLFSSKDANELEPQVTFTPTAVTGISATETPTITAGAETTNETPSFTPSAEDFPLEIHFIDVGQGDCALIRCKDEAMLIDAGDNSKGTAVQLYLQKQGVKKLKYFVVTHGDADHCGGADVVINKFDIETLFMPNESKNTATYRDVLDAAKYKNLTITRPVVGSVYELGTATFAILAPNKQYDGSNNNSIVILLEHDGNRFLFMGDAEEVSEADIIKNANDISADVIKIGHHGSYTATSHAFVDAVSPTFAVISAGEGNSYGHPHAETLITLRERAIKLYRTDEQGSIVAESSKDGITWNCSPSESWLQGERTGSLTNTVQTSGVEVKTYIINENTLKFHYESCSSAAKISEVNRSVVTGTRNELIDKGYSPCGACKP